MNGIRDLGRERTRKRVKKERKTNRGEKLCKSKGLNIGDLRRKERAFIFRRFALLHGTTSLTQHQINSYT